MKLIVKTQDTSKIKANATLVEELGDGFYLVETDDHTLLEPHVESIEHIDTPIKLQSEMVGNEYTVLPDDAEWARLRVISRTYPLFKKFVLADCNFTRKPELFMMDSGVNFTHEEFEGLETEDFYKVPVFDSFRDDAGHGTGIASVACGKNLGVHRHLKLMNVKIFGLNRMPSLLELGQAFDAIYQHHLNSYTVPKVINCSWNIPKSAYIETKINALLDAGVCVVGAAGNSGSDVGTLTPASLVEAVVVAASDKDDVSAGFNNFSEADLPITSNHGLTIDLFAPGVDVLVAKYKADNLYMKSSGTSISAGIASGAACAVLALLPNSFGDQVRQILIDTSTKGALLLDKTRFKADQNNLLYLISADETAKNTDISFFIDYFDADKTTITGNIFKILNTAHYKNVSGEEFTFECVFPDLTTEFVLKDLVTIDTATGILSVQKPTVAFDDGEHLKIFNFKVKATSDTGSISYTSPQLLFFVLDPDYSGSLTGQISTTLEDLNAQSLFAAWVPAMQIK